MVESAQPANIVKDELQEGEDEARVPSPTPRFFGLCKWFNVSKGFGFVVDDLTKEDLFVHQTNLNMQGFRSLDEGERVSYYIRERLNGKGREAYAVSGEVEGEGLKGSRIHPLGRKKAVALRCFRCGKIATHKAKNCPNVKSDSKVCYTCGSEDHVSSVCPDRKKREKKSEGSEGTSVSPSSPDLSVSPIGSSEPSPKRNVEDILVSEKHAQE